MTRPSKQFGIVIIDLLFRVPTFEVLTAVRHSNASVDVVIVTRHAGTDSR